MHILYIHILTYIHVGPLVRASLRASERSDIAIFVYALDKNPNAVVTLRNMRITENWLEKVEVVHSDMRDFNPPVLQHTATYCNTLQHAATRCSAL